MGVECWVLDVVPPTPLSPWRAFPSTLAGMKRTSLRGLYSPELLESRIAPATFLVTNLLDAGAGSLRAAIDGIGGVGGANDAPGADTVTFSPALFPGGAPGIITLTTGEIPISDTLKITGPGIDRLTISGNNASRIFNIADGDRVMVDPGTTYSLLQVGADVAVRLGTAGDEIVLLGVKISQLTTGWIFGA